MCVNKVFVSVHYFSRYSYKTNANALCACMHMCVCVMCMCVCLCGRTCVNAYVTVCVSVHVFVYVACVCFSAQSTLPTPHRLANLMTIIFLYCISYATIFQTSAEEKSTHVLCSFQNYSRVLIFIYLPKYFISMFRCPDYFYIRTSKNSPYQNLQRLLLVCAP